MHASKEKTTFATSTSLENMLSRSYSSKEEFMRDYEELCGGNSKAKELYLLVLVELEKAISGDDIERLKKLSTLIAYTTDLESKVTWRECYDTTGNPIRSTNLIILASKYNRMQILQYLLDSDSELLNNLSVGSGRDSISPKDEDDVHHNAFYYATRSEDIQLLDTLIANKYFNDYFAVHSEELEEILSKTYEELQLRNVPLSDEMQCSVERRLIDQRFFSTGQQSTSNITEDVLTKTEQRMELLLQSIALLKVNYSKTKKIDGIFLYVARFIAQNIHILKGRLRSSYDRIPWEEMEFCLVIFISSQTSIDELNLFYRTILNKKKILNHLENFANKLREEEDITRGKQLHCLPRGQTREKIVVNIIKNYPQFEELYNGYHEIRDIYSLRKINDHIKLALLADAQDKQEQLVIIRMLQVIGEHLKTTLESPKLSHTTSEILVLSLSQTARNIIIDLRDAISHADTLTKLIEIEKNADVNLFVNIQDDIKKVGDVINDILYKNRIKTIRLLLKQLVESETLDEMKELDLSSAELDIKILENFKTTQHEKVERLIKELSDNIVNQTNYEKELFNQINSIIIRSSENQTENVRFNYLMGYIYLRSFSVLLNYNNDTNANLIKTIKDLTVNNALKDLSVTMPVNEFEEIIQLLIKISRSVKLRVENDKFFEVKMIVRKINYIIKFETTDFESIEELREKFPKRKRKKTNLYEDKYNNDFELKLNELKAIISNNSLDGFKSDKKLQTIVRMLVLDIMVILGVSVDYLENNHLFLDDNAPLLHGKCLRNYLAHDNVLIDVLFSDPLIALKLNAEKLASEENIMERKKRIGKLVNDDPAKLRGKFDRDLQTITNQERMFAALEEGDLDAVKDCIQKGADIKARSNINSWTTLHFAAKGPSLEVVTFVVGQNLSVNLKDNNGETPLHVAAAHGRLDIVDFLLNETDICVDVSNIKGKTPLHFAARDGHTGIVEVLLQNKANIFTEDSFGDSPLIHAIRNNRIGVVTILLGKDLNVNTYDLVSESTVLHVTAVYGHLELLHILVENGADINARLDLNEVPLHFAACGNHLEMVKALIDLGANVNVRCINDWMPLHLAVHQGNVEIVNTLLTNGAHVNAGPATPLHLAVNFGNIEIVAVLLNRGADINAEFNNRTPLYHAALNGHKKVVEFLIHCGAQINPTENDKPTALHAAVKNSHRDVADLLIENQASVNAKTIEGITALHIAVFKDNKEIIDLLIRNKGDVSARSCDGWTPLHFAVRFGKMAAVDFLIKNGTNVNERADYGLTLLHLAVFGNHKEIVKLLIEKNPQVNLEDTGDDIPQPLHVAVLEGHKEMVEILIANGANINGEYSSIHSPLFYAINDNRKEIVKFLIENGASVNAEDFELLLINESPDMIETLIETKTYDVNHKDSNHYTPLHIAAFKRLKKIVKVLIKNGADVDAVSVYNETPLLCAAREGFEDVVRILIEHKPEVSLKNNEDSTPLCAAAARGHSEVVKVLLDNKVNFAPVGLAAAGGHLEVVKIFLESTKLNINAKDENGFTLLHIASHGTNLELVKYLVDKGSDINATTGYGYKAIHVSAREGCKGCVEFFIDMGLSVNELGGNNETLLHCAAMGGNLEVVNYLIKNRADVNAKDAMGNTPMDCAAIGGFKDVFELLRSTVTLFKAVKKNSSSEVQDSITAGAFVNARNAESNETPLHYAASEGYDEVARVLLQNNANPNVVNTKGITPLHCAAKCSHLKVAKVLLSYYAVYNAVSHDGKTPSDLTEDESILSLFKLMRKSFKNIEDGNSRVIDDLERLDDVDTVKAIMCARNTENKTLVIAAMHSNFSKVQQLKEIAEGDISARIKNATELCDEQENFQEALDMFKDAVRKRTEILGPDNPGTLDIQKYIGKVLLKQCDYPEAFKIFKEILPKQEEMLGLYHTDTLNTKRLIASVMYGQGKNEEALGIFREIYQKQIDLLGFHDYDTVSTQWEMALILNEQEKYEEALDIFRLVYRNTKPDDHEIALSVQYNIAMVLSNQGNYEQAMGIYKEIFKKKKKDHSVPLAALSNIGEIFINKEKYDKALAVLRELLNMQKEVLEPNHPDILRTQLNIGNVFFRKRKWISALKVYSEGFDQMKAAFGSNHPDVLKMVKRTETIKVRLKLTGIGPSDYIPYLQKIINIPAGKDDIQMLEDVADSNDQDQFRQTSLHYAISNGHINAVSILLKHGADVNQVSNEGLTPLHTATFNGYKEIAEILLQHVKLDKLNCFINAKTTESGATALHVAATMGFSDIVMFLLEQGAIYDIKNNEGKTPLDLCKDESIRNILKLVEELFRDAENGNRKIIEKLIELKRDVYVAVKEVRNNQNYTISQVFDRANRRSAPQ